MAIRKGYEGKLLICADRQNKTYYEIKDIKEGGVEKEQTTVETPSWNTNGNQRIEKVGQSQKFTLSAWRIDSDEGQNLLNFYMDSKSGSAIFKWYPNKNISTSFFLIKGTVLTFNPSNPATEFSELSAEISINRLIKVGDPA